MAGGQLGLPGWGWADVAPLFVAQEDHIAPPGPLHGRGGEWRVEHPRLRWAVLDAFAEAAALEGIPPVADFNGGDNFGSGYFQVNQRAGRRWSAARGFLKPVLRRPNLRLETHAHVQRVVIENGRASGVVWERGGQRFEARAAGEVVLAAGRGHPAASRAFRDRRWPPAAPSWASKSRGTPARLRESLPRPPADRADLPGSPARPPSTPSTPKAWRPPLMALECRPAAAGADDHNALAAGRLRRWPELATPNLQFHVQPLSLDAFGEPLHRFGAITVSVANLRPTSRGAVHAASPDPAAAPRQPQPNLATTEDARVVESLRLVRRILAQPPLRRFGPEHGPGAEAVTDGDLLASARALGTTIFHPQGTARMGRAGDPMAVTVAALRVRGVAALRVADASIMPAITSGNTNSPTLMIAEAARMMLAKMSFF